jgi:cytochrome c oxidase subunit 3/cytochrome o ubiquinol oxidase subunit 3
MVLVDHEGRPAAGEVPGWPQRWAATGRGIVTAMLGATFVGGQVYEFTAFYNEGLGFSTSLFGSSFYTLTGFHGVHVTVGIIMLLALVAINKRSKVPGSKSETVEMLGLYWHFVDVVWIIIFTLVYLIPV